MAAHDDYPSHDELDELEDTLERTGLPSEQIEKRVKAAATSRRRYEKILHHAKLKAVGERDRDWPLPDYPGRFTIGQDPDGRPVGLTDRQLNEHMLVVGRSGAGKTTFFYNVMDLLNDDGVPFLAFDFKNDYRAVADDLDLTVINWRDLKFNPLQPPPGVSTEKWAEVMADTWTHAMGLLNASRNYFLGRLRRLYGLYHEAIDEGRYPTLYELRDLARAHDIPYASPRYNYKERLVNRTNGMLAFSGDIFDCSRGHPIEELLDRNVVLELQDPNRDVQTFMVEALLTWIFYYRDAQDHRDRGLRHAVLFDEAKHVFDVQREQN